MSLYSPASTKRVLSEYFCEYSRGFGISELKTFRGGQWALAKIGDEWNAWLRIGRNWHRWHADGSSASGDGPAPMGGLGDVIGTDAQLDRYEKLVADCPGPILRLVNVR